MTCILSSPEAPKVFYTTFSHSPINALMVVNYWLVPTAVLAHSDHHQQQAGLVKCLAQGYSDRGGWSVRTASLW